MSALGSQSVSEVGLEVPRFGVWHADVLLAGGAAPTVGDAVVLTVADLELQGTILRAGLDGPGKPRAVVVGAPGWERRLARPLSYQSDGGVRLSSVLHDLSVLAGETIEQPADKTIPAGFSAIAGCLLRDVLATLHRRGHVAPWRVDPDGVTRFGARIGSEFTGRATVLRADAALGCTVLGVDGVAGLLPGNLLSGSAIQRLGVYETAGALTAEAWS